MNTKTKIEKQINSAVTKGKLPVAFINSLVLDVENNKTETFLRLSKKYAQLGIPKGSNELTTSKIYELP